MPILNGSIDKRLDKERKDITKYIKKGTKITVDNSKIPRFIRDIYVTTKKEKI